MFKSSTLLTRGGQIFLLGLSIFTLGLLSTWGDGMSPEAKNASSTDREADYSSGFVPLPEWARHGHLPPMPDQLKPFGKPPTPATTPTPPPTPAPTTVTAPAPKPAPADADAHKDEPPLTAISPFLEWVKSDPDAAAALAKKEAAKYSDNSPSPPPPDSGGFDPNRPYWLPPIRNSTDNNTAPAETSSSSATYQRPSQ